MVCQTLDQNESCMNEDVDGTRDEHAADYDGANDSAAEAFVTVSGRSGIDVGTTDGESAVARHSSSAPQRITKVMGKPRSCQARRPPASARTCSIPRRRNAKARRAL